MTDLLKSYSVNANAKKILDEKVIPHADRLGVSVSRLSCGTTIIDMGIHVKGGFLAGKYFVETGLGGLGRLTFGKMRLNKHIVPSLRITVSAPEVAELSSHVAMFHVPYQGQTVVVSGPIRALPEGKDYISSVVDYTDHSEVAVGLIQTSQIPDDGLAVLIAEKAHIKPENLTLVVAPTATLTGSIQVGARNVEQSLPTLVEKGFSMDQIVEGYGVTPLISVTDDEMVAYGRVNDSLIYGQETTVYVRCEDEKITDILEVTPFCKNTDVYGTQFQYLWEQCNGSWATVPRDWDAPCKVNFINLTTGRVFTAGQLNKETLEQSFMGDGGKDL